MTTFFEFYETLLGFVLFKLYGDLGVRYPMPVAVAGDATSVASGATLHPTLGGTATSVLSANLSALQTALHESARGNSAVDAVRDAVRNKDISVGGEPQPATKATKKEQKKLMRSIDEALKGVNEEEEASHSESEGEGMDQNEDAGAPVSAPLREALEAIDDSALSDEHDGTNIITNPAAQKRHRLFHKLTFFLSREVPRGYLELVILSYGGRLGWEGQDSPISMNDGTITHHIVDRPKLLPSYSTLPKSREYIQPQWILDCTNFNFCLPVEKYSVGSELPPHLSPWVDDKEEGYVPKYKEEVERLRNGEMMDESNNEEPRMIANEEREVEALSLLEQDPSSSSGSPRKNNAPEEKESSSSEEEEEDDNEVARRATAQKQKEVSIKRDDAVILSLLTLLISTLIVITNCSATQDDKAAQLGKSLMSKKAARLYGRMQHGIAQKQANVDNLHKKRREIENTREKSKDGKTVVKLKVERLKKERRDKEAKYTETGGSMKKKWRKN